MTCNTCGRQTANEEANFCENCGASFRKVQNFYETSKPEEKTTVQMTPSANDKKPMSVLKWLGFMVTIYIPYIGPFVYLGLLLMWSIRSDVNPNQKNWARATLIFGIITIAILMIYMSRVFAEIVNSGGTFEEYFKNLYTL